MLGKEIRHGGLLIDGNKGESYYQMVLFRTKEGTLVYQVTSKIRSDGKIEAKMTRFIEHAVIDLGILTKEQFEKRMAEMLSISKESRLTCKLIDFTEYKTIAEQLSFLKKIEPEIRINISKKEE